MNSKVKSVGILDVNQSDLVTAVAAHLKRTGKLKIPEWVDIVKTGIHKELAPIDEDWFYVRCAAVARRVAVRSPVGVGALTKIFGGKKRRGVVPSKFVRASNSVARKALQALEAIKWIEKDPNGGRRLAKEGRRDLDRIARQVKSKNRKIQNLESFLVTQQ